MPEFFLWTLKLAETIEQVARASLWLRLARQPPLFLSLVCHANRRTGQRRWPTRKVKTHTAMIAAHIEMVLRYTRASS